MGSEIEDQCEALSSTTFCFLSVCEAGRCRQERWKQTLDEHNFVAELGSWSEAHYMKSIPVGGHSHVDVHTMEKKQDVEMISLNFTLRSMLSHSVWLEKG